jgi:hypothetical protein
MPWLMVKPIMAHIISGGLLVQILAITDKIAG